MRISCLYRLSRYPEVLCEAGDMLAEVEARMAEGKREEWLGFAASAWNNIARVKSQTGRIGEAMDAYRRTRDIEIERGNRHGAANALNGIGIAHNAQGDWEAGLAAYREALAVFREQGDKWGIAMVLTNISNTEFASGHPEESLASAREGLAIRREIGDRWGAALILGNIGWHQAQAGDYAEALESLGESLADQRATGDRQSAARTLEHIAAIHADLGDLPRAVAEIEEACAAWESIVSPVKKFVAQVERAHILGEAGRGEEGAALLDAVLAEAAPETLRQQGAGAWLERAWLRVSSRPKNARDDALRAVEAARAFRQSETESMASAALALAESALGNHDAALKALGARVGFPANGSFRDRLRLVEAEATVRLAAGDRTGAKAWAVGAVALAASKGAIPAQTRLAALAGAADAK